MIHEQLREAVVGWLREAMERKGLNVTAVATLSHLSRQTVSRILNEHGEPDEETVKALATGLGVDPPSFTMPVEAPKSPVAPRATPVSTDRARAAPSTLPGRDGSGSAGRITEDLDARPSSDLRLLLRGALMGEATYARLKELLDALDLALEREKKAGKP